MNLVFLDYDGVINTILFKEGSLIPRLNFPKDGKVNNFQAVMWLNKLCLETNAKIVVTSTWRKWDNYIDVLYNSGLDSKIEVLGKTPELGKRCKEIRSYLASITFPVEHFVILDDDRIGGFEKNQVKCDFWTGFTFHGYQKALSILTKKDENEAQNKN